MTTFQSSLKRILGDNSNDISFPVVTTSRNTNPFWYWLINHEHDLSALQKPWVLPTFFATYGWMQVAAEFTPENLREETPDWVRYTLAKACEVAGESRKADRIANQEDISGLMLLRSEKLVAEGKKKEALVSLEKLVSDDVVGFRATYLLCETYLDLNRPDEALRVLNSNTKLDISVQGQEMRARILLARNNQPGAIGIYKAIVDESDIAKFYLAKVSYLHEDYITAEKLTKQLLLNHPMDALLLKNLNFIESKLSSSTSVESRTKKSPER